MAGITVPGIGSGLDVNSIVSQLMAVERQPEAAMATKEAKYQAQLTAYGSIKGAVSALQDTMQGLADAATLRPYAVKSSDTDIVTATVGSGAVAGNYALDVTALAQSQKLIAQGQASSTAAIGTGTTTTLTFDFGTISGGSFDSGTGRYTGATFTSSGAGTETVTIDSSNNTLAGIRDAINRAGIGVTASIISDGSASPYRLVLTSAATGKAQSMKISVSGDATLGALLGEDPAGTQNLVQTTAAQDASLKVDGIAITGATNTITDAIPGVALTLLGTTASSEKITVSQDAGALSSSVNAFVKAYNDVNKKLSDLSAYDADTKQAAILNGDATVRSLQAQIRAALNSALTGVAGGYSLLSDIGVSFQKDGSLAVDTAKLDAAVSAHPEQFAALFAVAGAPTDSLVTYTTSTENTKPGTYAVNVTRLATRGNIAGSAAAGLTITAGVNDTLDVTLGGSSATIVLTPGTYATAAALAAEVQAQIDGNATFTGADVSMTTSEASGVITLTSNDYGAAAGITVTGGNGLANLLGGAPATTAGLDAAGTINGVAAAGSGQYLTGATGDAAEGLKLLVSGTTLGARGTVDFSQGYAYRLNALATHFLDGDGEIASRTDGINRSIQDIDDQRAAFEQRMSAVETNYRAQFTALDTLISSMNQTSQYLTQQLASLSQLNN